MSENCLTCKHWRPNRAAEWKAAYDGHEFDIAALAHFLGEQPLNWPGQCTLNPEWLQRASSHGCGQHAFHSLFTLNWWEFCARFERDPARDLRAELKREKAKSKALREKLRALKQPAGPRPRPARGSAGRERAALPPLLAQTEGGN